MPARGCKFTPCSSSSYRGKIHQVPDVHLKGWCLMAESIKVAQYFKVAVPDKPGEAVRMLDAVKGAGVNLLAFSGFPRGKKAQLDFVPEDPARFKEVAKYNKWKVQ